MTKTVQIKIGGNAPTQKFDAEIELNVGDRVIVETANGSEWGIVATVAAETKRSGGNNLVMRVANSQDNKTIDSLIKGAEHACRITEERIQKFKLDMKLLSAHYTLDGNKIIIQFHSENRVDFRELVRDLATTLRTRIELKQVGARDEARLVGAMGQCGMECCCARFLNNFDNVSIKMAKNQNISLNPQKINGMCGRLLCCLAYENDYYTEVQEKMPKWNSEVITPDGKGVAKDVNVIKQTVNVQFQNGDMNNYKCYKLCECKCKHCGRGEK
jgi:cell fate regulator YaaT (PSP1 superfamily)